ncbi:hypothetical protein BC827DRAFT_72064 [Russula dissimulans]|nr:hypothetical protein BC827DRAFT_72064 [Russula dissimulans]
MSGSTAISAEQSTSRTHVLNHPHADIILRSGDSLEFKVAKVYLIDSSPVLAKLIQSSSHHSEPNVTVPIADVTSLPVIQLSDRAEILSSLLTFIIPITPDLPSTADDTLELLSTAQKYEMEVILTRIRDHLAKQKPPLIRDETAFQFYSLAQKYGLRREADQAARLTLGVPMSVQTLEAAGRLDVLSGALLHELWRYHQRVREYLADDLTVFANLAAGARINFRCVKLTSSDVPMWLHDYIDSIARDPALFDRSEFHTALMRHVSRPPRICISCTSISIKTIDSFWTALSDVVQRSIENVRICVQVVNMTSNDTATLSG